jgi:hypothetical protein
MAAGRGRKHSKDFVSPHDASHPESYPPAAQIPSLWLPNSLATIVKFHPSELGWLKRQIPSLMRSGQGRKNLFTRGKYELIGSRVKAIGHE